MLQFEADCQFTHWFLFYFVNSGVWSYSEMIQLTKVE